MRSKGHEFRPAFLKPSAQCSSKNNLGNMWATHKWVREVAKSFIRASRSHPGGNALDEATGAWCSCAYKCRVKDTRDSTKRGSSDRELFSSFPEAPTPETLAGDASSRAIRMPRFLSAGSPEQYARTAGATSPGVARSAIATARGRKHLLCRQMKYEYGISKYCRRIFDLRCTD